MGRVCAWCRSIIHKTTSASKETTHGLCRGCLEELQLALASNGIRTSDTMKRLH